jgi:hypothetical protein
MCTCLRLRDLGVVGGENLARDRGRRDRLRRRRPAPGTAAAFLHREDHVPRPAVAGSGAGHLCEDGKPDREPEGRDGGKRDNRRQEADA